MTEVHPYERACRNTQHSGCTCMHPVGGKWCGLPRNDPVHADQPTEAPSAAGREPISHAEFARFVTEATEQRERAERAERERDAARFAIDQGMPERIAMHQVVQRMRGELFDIARMVGAQEDETTLRAVQDMMTERDDARADVEAVRAHWQRELSTATDVIAETGAMLNDARAALLAVGELVGAQDDETTLQAVQDMMTERQHYVRECNRMVGDLASTQARADGYELFVKELIGHLVVVTDFGSAGGGWADWACLCCHATRFGAADAQPQIVHEPDCILAADPEARAHELMAREEG